MKKYLILLTISALLLAGAGGFALTFSAARESAEGQDAAERWSDGTSRFAQVTCMYAAGSGLSADGVAQLASSLESKLQSDSITAKEGARLFVCAYSCEGTLSISKEQYGSTVSVSATAVGGDFFLFHPLRLLSGCYPPVDSLNGDELLLDDVAAWQLFGSNDVAGMTVYLGGKPYIVTGVAERGEGELYDEVYGSKPRIYLSFSAMSRTKGSAEALCCEFLLPDPVSGYALGAVSESASGDESTRVLVENSARFDTLPLYARLGGLAERSVRTTVVTYPYWENVASAAADRCALLLLGQTVCLTLAALTAAACGVTALVANKITGKRVFNAVWSRVDARIEKRRERNYARGKNDSQEKKL